ncbi:MAG: hypothetical protein MJ197_08355 [Bacteroidales bacterium]|nr:hypothetical protein [Bacteroidales bacterium]
MESSTIGKQTEFVPFVKTELIARQVLVDNRYGSQTFQPLDRNGISKNSNDFVHFVIVGMTEMGRSMAKIAALVAHYPNFETHKTRITFIDSCAEDYWLKIKEKYQYVLDCSHYTFSKVVDNTFVEIEKYAPQDDFLDIEWDFIHADICSSIMQAALQTWSEKQNVLFTVAICHDESQTNQQIVMSLPQKIVERHIPIYVYQQNSDWLLELAKSSTKYNSVKAFGMFDDCEDFYSEKFIHAGRMLNYVYSKGSGKIDFPLEKVEENWQLADLSNKKSSVYNALHIKTKLRSIGINKSNIMSEEANAILIDNLAQLGKVEHNRWVTERLLQGYRPVSDEEKQEVDKHFSNKKKFKDERNAHYDIRSLEELTDEIQSYDTLMIRNIVRIALESHLLEI